MKKTIGLILISFGFALITFIIYIIFRDKNRIISPLPEEKGVKVIQISPKNTRQE
jgi:hypothetical protein